MSLFDFILGKRPFPAASKPEIDRMIHDLIRIGEREDFLSERSGGPFNAQCRNSRAIEIGKRLNEIGGFDLMEFVLKKVRKRLGAKISSHLSYAWTDIGKWVP